MYFMGSETSPSLRANFWLKQKGQCSESNVRKAYKVFQNTLPTTYSTSLSLSSAQVTGVQHLAIYICFLAKLASFSKSGRANVSYSELFDIV